MFDFLGNFFYRKLGWDPKSNEGHLDAMLRGELLTSLAELGHDITTKEAVRRFYAFLDDRNTSLLPPDIRKVRIWLYIFNFHTHYSLLMFHLKCPVGCICCCDADCQQFEQTRIWISSEGLQRNWSKPRKRPYIKYVDIKFYLKVKKFELFCDLEGLFLHLS